MLPWQIARHAWPLSQGLLPWRNSPGQETAIVRPKFDVRAVLAASLCAVRLAVPQAASAQTAPMTAPAAIGPYDMALPLVATGFVAGCGAGANAATGATWLYRHM
jgi:hypothetical protein